MTNLAPPDSELMLLLCKEVTERQKGGALAMTR
jgi:hypothetical protein